jgi:hypothetical protein
MRFSIKPLLMLMLGSLVLLGQGRASVPSASLPQASAEALAERMLSQWLGGPVALCTSSGQSTPRRVPHDPACGLCCLVTDARGLALPPTTIGFLPPVRSIGLRWRRPSPSTRALPARFEPQQPRAPPEGV